MLGNSRENLVPLNPLRKPTLCPPVNDLAGHCLWIFGRYIIGWFSIETQEVFSKITRQRNPVDQSRAAVLDCTEELLKHCPASCEHSCTKCLRHYGTRFLHPRLDRRLALHLLRYARRGEIPAVASSKQQSHTLRPPACFLELEGWKVVLESSHGSVTILLLATSPSRSAIAIGTPSALISTEHANQTHSLRSHDPQHVLVLPDYVVERDLPAAYRFLMREYPSEGQ